jgi:hypothetical protein
MYSYHLREVLLCWLFFSLAFVSMALVVLTGVLVCHAGGHAIAWGCKAARVMSNIVLGQQSVTQPTAAQQSTPSPVSQEASVETRQRAVNSRFGL